MTCVVGLVADDEVWIGTDSAAVDANNSLQHVRGKLVRLALGESSATALLGYTTSFRMGQILAHHVALPAMTWRPSSVESNVEAYVVQRIVPVVRGAFRDGGWAKKENEREQGGTFIVACKGRLFGVWDDFSVIEPTSGYEAVGSGRYEALGALYATEGMAARERVETALRAAEHFNGTVRGPFVVEKL